MGKLGHLGNAALRGKGVSRTKRHHTDHRPERRFREQLAVDAHRIERAERARPRLGTPLRPLLPERPTSPAPSNAPPTARQWPHDLRGWLIASGAIPGPADEDSA